eukprot:COSAG01_NODE_909_length_12785_cov_4.201876_15_plen_43_part_00
MAEAAAGLVVEHATRFIEEKLARTMQESFGIRLIDSISLRDD